MKTKPHLFFTRVKISFLCGLAMLMLALPVRAQIALQDGSTAITYTASATVSQSFTATPGASVMVVVLLDHAASAINSEPATLSWNGQTLLQAVATNNFAATFRDIAIYYLYNPTPGTANITGSIANGATDYQLMAYTLVGVNTLAAPLIGADNAADSTASSVTTCTVSAVPSGSWAAVGSYLSEASGNVTITAPTGGTVTTSTDTANGNTAFTAGYVANLPAGSDSFTGTTTATANKIGIVAAIFSPPVSGVPTIFKAPQADVLYPNRTAVFKVVGGGTPPLSYQWSSNSTPLTDGGNISGSATPTLTVSNVQFSDSANYSVVVSNNLGTASAAASLLVVLPVQKYEAAVSNLNPVAYYQFDEVASPALGNVPAFDYAGGFTGTYGNAVMNGFNAIAGPTPTAGFPGFAATNEENSYKIMTKKERLNSK